LNSIIKTLHAETTCAILILNLQRRNLVS